MSELTHGAMLVGAVAGAACAVTDWRRTRAVRPQALEAGASIVMVAAMVDTAVTGFVPVLAWAAALVTSGLALGARMRLARPRPRPPAGPPHEVLGDLHRALAFIVSGWLMVGAAASGTAALGTASTAAHAHGATAGLAPLAGTLAVLVLGGWLIAHAMRSGRGARHAAEAASMSVMLAAMAWPA